MNVIKWILVFLVVVVFTGVTGYFLYDNAFAWGEKNGYESAYPEGKKVGYDSGKRAGYEEGYNSGKTNGYDEGYEEGYTTGEQDGYNSGYIDGKDAGYIEGYDNVNEDILEQGEADFIGLGRSLLADPEFPRKVADGKPKEIRKCIACMNCLHCIGFMGKPINCTVNPNVGVEKLSKLKLTRQPKKVLVIGGGPSGMEAARISALRGHKVTLWDKEDKLGGLLNIAILPPYKKEIKNLINYLQHQIKILSIPVKLNMEATEQMVMKAKPEVVIVATGSRQYIPEIKGLEFRQ